MREYIIELELSKIDIMAHYPDIRQSEILEYAETSTEAVLGNLIKYGEAVVSISFVEDESDELGRREIAIVYDRDGI